jgi:hypothetical protein
MSLSRRQFHQYSAQFLLSSLFPVAFAKLLRPSLSEAEMTQHLKTAYHAFNHRNRIISSDLFR